MTDALNQMIHHKREETLPCSADAGHPVPVLPFSLSAQDNANKVQVAQTTPECLYINATPSAAWMCCSGYLCEVLQ